VLDSSTAVALVSVHVFVMPAGVDGNARAIASLREEDVAHAPLRALRQPVRMAWTAAAPTIGSLGAAKLGG
jgi:hypothetical protein